MRGLCIDAVLRSRKLIAIPNTYTQQVLSGRALDGLDGELVVGEPTDKKLMQNTMGGVMSRDG